MKNLWFDCFRHAVAVCLARLSRPNLSRAWLFLGAAVAPTVAGVWRTLFALFALLGFMVAPCWAGFVILKNGKIIETRGLPEQGHDSMRFTLESGGLVAMPLAQIDLQATAQANQDPDAFAAALQARRRAKAAASSAADKRPERPKPIGSGARPSAGATINNEVLQQRRSQDYLAAKLTGLWLIDANNGQTDPLTKLALYPSGRGLVLQGDSAPRDFVIHVGADQTLFRFPADHPLAGDHRLALAGDRRSLRLQNGSDELRFNKTGESLPVVDASLTTLAIGEYVYDVPTHWQRYDFQLADGASGHVLTNRVTHESFALGRWGRGSGRAIQEKAFILEVLNIILQQLDERWEPRQLVLTDQEQFYLKIGERRIGTMNQFGFQAFGKRQIVHIIRPTHLKTPGHFLVLFSDTGAIPSGVDAIIRSQINFD